MSLGELIFAVIWFLFSIFHTGIRYFGMQVHTLETDSNWHVDAKIFASLLVLCVERCNHICSMVWYGMVVIRVKEHAAKILYLFHMDIGVHFSCYLPRTHFLVIWSCTVDGMVWYGTIPLFTYMSLSLVRRAPVELTVLEICCQTMEWNCGVLRKKSLWFQYRWSRCKKEVCLMQD